MYSRGCGSWCRRVATTPCIVALSEAAPEIGVRYRHTWNVVTVEGQRYHVDATFDNSLQRGMKRYDYFNLDDRHIFRDQLFHHRAQHVFGGFFFQQKNKCAHCGSALPNSP